MIQRLLLIALFATSIPAVAQEYFNISGPQSVCVDGVTTYTYTGGCTCLSWWVTGGVFTSQYTNTSTVTVRWTSTSGTLTASGTEQGECYWDDAEYPPIYRCEGNVSWQSNTPFNVSGTVVAGGTLSGESSVCTGSNVSLTLSGHTGSIIGWERKIGNSWSSIPSTSNPLTYQVTEVTEFKALVKAGACTKPSASHTVTPYPASSGGKTIVSNPAYAAVFGVLSVTGQTGNVVRWEKNDGGTWVNTGITTPTLPLSGLTKSTQFRAAVKNQACSEAYSAVITAELRTLVHGGGTVTLTAPSGTTRQWYRNDTTLAGETGPTYVASKPAAYSVKVDGSATGLYLVHPFSRGVNAISSTVILKEGVSASTNLYTLAAAEVSQNVAYLDALGQPFQTISVGSSPTGYDLVVAASQGKHGIPDTSFLPYASTVRTGAYRPEALRKNTGYGQSEQYKFYENAPKVASDTKPYSVSVRRATLDAAITEQGAPGSSWQPGSGGHAVKSAIVYNNSSDKKVRFWRPNGITSAFYPDNTVAISILTDENGNKVRTFVNALGQTVLKQVQIDEQLDGESTTTEWLETYYVYDEIGRLKWIVPPKAMKVLGTGTTLVAGTASVSNLIYKFTYDSRNRVYIKKEPGAEEVHVVYDFFDRPVFTQDGNQRSLSKWTFVKYDAFNRVAYSGIYNRNVTRGVLQAEMASKNYNASEHYYDTLATNKNGYTNRVYPTTNLMILAVNYYDSYDFNNDAVPDHTFDAAHLAGQVQSASVRTRGMATGSKQTVINQDGDTTSTWLKSVVFYDGNDRPVQTQSNNHLYATVADKSTVIYDFPGRVLRTKTTKYQNSSTAVDVVDSTTYDHAGRVIRVYRRIGSQKYNVALYAYNELGQLVDKKLHGDGSGGFMQSVDYRYNIRGWLRSINGSELATSGDNDDTNDFFGMDLLYQTTESGLVDSAYYNGNISAIKWKGPYQPAGTSGRRSYEYRYDKSDRLKWAKFRAYGSGDWTKEVNTLNERLTYDHNGNILTLNRRRDQPGMSVSGSTISITSTSQVIDQLTYSYMNSNQDNRIFQVEDATGNAAGFNNGATASNEFAYNDAGALKVDKNQGITTAITFNFLGKPGKITYSDGRKVEYTYSASGAKLTMKALQGTTVKACTNYSGGFVYEGSTPALSFFSSPEGRVVKNGSNYEFQYTLSDHQGNTRVLFTSATQAADLVTANMENPTNGDFLNAGTNRVPWDLFDNTDAGTTYQYSQKLTGATNQQVGVAWNRKVYPGDKVEMVAYAKYEANSGTSNLSGFATALLAAFGYSTPPAGGETGTPKAGLNTRGAIVAGGSGPGEPGHPKAFVNLIVFDKHYNILTVEWEQINGGNQVGASPDVPHDSMRVEYTAKEEGYIYAYVSNENPTLVNVYFDDVKVKYTPSPVIQYNEYYPFGLPTANSWTRTGVTGNNYTGNGGSEMNDTTGWYEMAYRNYDPALGRMTSIDPLAVKYAGLSPYNYAFNDPVTFSDPSGAEPGMDPVYGYENSWRYDGSSRMYDDVVYNRVIGWTSSGASFVNNLDWMYAGAGEGITGRGHWAVGLRTLQENLKLMSVRNFFDHYGVDGNNEDDMFDLGLGLSVVPTAENLAGSGARLISSDDEYDYLEMVLSPAVYSTTRGRIGDQHTGLIVSGRGGGDFWKRRRELLAAVALGKSVKVTQGGNPSVLQAGMGPGMTTDEFRGLLDGILLTTEGFLLKHERSIEAFLKSPASKGERHIFKTGLKNVKFFGHAAGVLAVGVSWWEASERGTTGAYSLATLDTIMAGATLFFPVLAPITFTYGVIRLGADMAGVDVAGGIDKLIK